MRVWSKAVDCFFTGHSAFMISLGDNIEPDFTPKGCWTSCLLRGFATTGPAIHRFPLAPSPPHQRVRWRERKAREKMAVFLSECWWSMFEFQGSERSHFPMKLFHLSFAITCVPDSHQFLSSSISEKCMKCMALFSFYLLATWLYLFSEKCPDAEAFTKYKQWMNAKYLACTSVFISQRASPLDFPAANPMAISYQLKLISLCCLLACK